jgi:CO/xanthine dehydrogenase FAD-binding subunit
VKHFRQFVTAHTEEEAVSLRKTVGQKSLYIAGGTGVVPHSAPSVEVLIDISRLGLDGVTLDNGRVSIGATTPLSDLISAEIETALPLLYEAVRRCATPLIRNMATVGGSLAGIFLPSDIGVALLALGADAEIRGDGIRTIAMEQLLSGGWLTGPDLITRILINRSAPGQGAGFIKFGRSDIDIALVNAATVLTVADGKIARLRVAVGQTSSMPVLLAGLVQRCQGRRVTHELIDEVSDLAVDQVKPRSDYRASADYRRHLIKVLVARSLVAAAEEVGTGLED